MRLPRQTMQDSKASIWCFRSQRYCNLAGCSRRMSHGRCSARALWAARSHLFLAKATACFIKWVFRVPAIPSNPPCLLRMQNDGNLVEYMASGWRANTVMCLDCSRFNRKKRPVLNSDIRQQPRGCELRRNGARLAPCAKHRRTESALLWYRGYGFLHFFWFR